MKTPIVKVFSGSDVQRHLPEVARLRITVFREFPYLYDGDMEYEQKYLSTYTESPDSVIAIAFDEDKVIGASTAVPLQHEPQEVQQPFLDHQIDPVQVFYLGESVLLQEYRGQGIGVRFFEQREAHARRLGEFQWYAFCAVQRSSSHPRCPQNYEPLDRFWNHRGYHKHPELHTTFTWQDLDEDTQTPKPMTFWLKPCS
ncbi:MAG: GNAT family N-acetyltransferase [Gammaproteobacteria bacterium]|nr:GNAT family N-acetyltransferase [Gammaproteobacteria bacterium]MDH5799687.1 GNAT family N-acetyltransferase [Gammaproteobacteria bacterium]